MWMHATKSGPSARSACPQGSKLDGYALMGETDSEENSTSPLCRAWGAVRCIQRLTLTVRACTHLAPKTSWKFLLGPLSKGHCVTLCFSNISMVVTLSQTIRECIPSSPPKLRAKAMSTINASRVSANLQAGLNFVSNQLQDRLQP